MHADSQLTEAIVPAVLWMILDRRSTLAQLRVEPYWPGPVILVVLALVWLVGTLGNSNAPAQLAMAMVPSEILTVIDVNWVRASATDVRSSNGVAA